MKSGLAAIVVGLALAFGGAVQAQTADWRTVRTELSPRDAIVSWSVGQNIAPGAWAPEQDDFLGKVALKIADRFADLHDKGSRPVRLKIDILGFSRERRFGSETAINYVTANVTVVDSTDGTVLRTFEGLTGAIPESFNPVAGWLMRQFVPDPSEAMANALAVTVRRTWDR